VISEALELFSDITRKVAKYVSLTISGESDPIVAASLRLRSMVASRMRHSP